MSLSQKISLSKEPATKEKKQSGKVFQISWLDIPEYKEWLEPIKNDNRKAFCRACNSTFICGKSEVEKHKNSSKHFSNVKSAKNPSVSDFFERNESPHNKNVKRAEMKLAAFFAEHNVAFKIVDHLIPLLKNVFNDSRICQDVHLGRTKATKVVTNVLSKVQCENLCNILKCNNFSVLLDESTDIGCQKNLCCVVRFVNPLHKKVRMELLELICLDARDCSGEVLYSKFKKCLSDKNIPITNVCGLGCDNAAVIIGKNNSFFSRSKNDVPGILLMKCTCHSAALVASKASREIPERCEELLRITATYVSESPKTCAILAEFQEYFNTEKLKLLSPAKTRWLSMHPCIVRFLENWTVLEHMFLYDSIETKRLKAKRIYEIMQDQSTKAYLLFLKYILCYFNSFNALFQSREVLIHILHRECNSLLQKICQNFIKSEYIDLLENMIILNDDHLMSSKDIYLGPECEEFLKVNFQSHEILEVKLVCLNFYKTAFTELKARFPLDEPIFKELEFLNPEIALNQSKRFHCKELEALRVKVGCSLNLNVEWRELPVTFPKEEKDKLITMNIEEFWAHIITLRSFEGEQMFPNLSKIVKYVLTLPHSNAESERIFSIVNEVKNSKRNRISGKSLNAICTVRSHFQAENITCVNFEPSQRHFLLNNSSNIYQ